MIYVIGSESDECTRILRDGGFSCRAFLTSEVPSLSVLSNTEDLTGVVILESAWSAQHLAAAARSFQPRRFALPTGLLPELPERWALRFDHPGELIALFKKAATTPVKPNPKRSPPSRHAVPMATHKNVLSPPLLLDRMPNAVILRLAVVGSQKRIGCTCQAFGLFHYCKALGFSPLLVMPEETRRELAAIVVDSDVIPEVVEIEHIPLASEEIPGYNCYIYDIGEISREKSGIMEVLDAAVLLLGVKPWELRCSILALRNMPPIPFAALIFMGMPADAAPFQHLLKGHPTESAQVIRNIYRPNAQTLQMWERLMWPCLKKMLGTYRTPQAAE